MEKWQAYWPDGRLYSDDNDGVSTFNWHTAYGIARIIGGTAQKVR